MTIGDRSPMACRTVTTNYRTNQGTHEKTRTRSFHPTTQCARLQAKMLASLGLPFAWSSPIRSRGFSTVGCVMAEAARVPSWLRGSVQRHILLQEGPRRRGVEPVNDV